jgi:thioredoxin 1
MSVLLQLWKNKEKAGQVIGGDQAWLVMDKIRGMLTIDQ